MISVDQIKIVHIPNMPVFKIRAVPYQWSEVKEIIDSNQLAKFARSEPESHRYIAFKKQLIKEDLTLFKYLLLNQLHWITEQQTAQIHEVADDQIIIQPHNEKLFYDSRDLMILKNDFPYHFDDDIIHLCVWTRFKVPVDPASAVGDISPRTRRIIERYLYKTFVETYGIKWENITWFKNWESLQSVPSLSHVHVVIKGMSAEVLKSVLYSPGVTLSEEELALE